MLHQTANDRNPYPSPYENGVFGDIGSSYKAHTVDALAVEGDERRGSLRKASGSWQTSIDPAMSEWGNPS
jgi:hypothetical protein